MQHFFKSRCLELTSIRISHLHKKRERQEDKKKSISILALQTQSLHVDVRLQYFSRKREAALSTKKGKGKEH